jgi:hypothetical protein
MGLIEMGCKYQGNEVFSPHLLNVIPFQYECQDKTMHGFFFSFEKRSSKLKDWRTARFAFFFYFLILLFFISLVFIFILLVFTFILLYFIIILSLIF